MTNRQIGFGLGIVILIIAAILTYVLYERNMQRQAFAEHVVSQSSGRWAQPDTVASLQKSISSYERRIARYVEAAARNATFWKLLAVRLQQRQLHGEALDALARAIQYAPEDPALHHFTGVSAAIQAKSFHQFPGRTNADRAEHFVLAEQAFLRAIELDDRYLPPRYSLGVLYVFDLDRPEDAVPHLQQVLEINRGNTDAMMVLARAFFMMANYQASVDLFDRIISITGDPERRREAQDNRERVLERMYGY